MAHSYNDTFFATADRTAALSAQGLIGCLAKELPAASVLDVGCGRGVWLAEWQRHGARDVLGIDGAYVNRSRLHIPEAYFQACDISQPISLGRKFGLVQSLEVAEHLPDTASETFIDNLVRHGDIILFSAAIPGQGGEYHVNEQPWEYWRKKFAARGFELFDFLRPRVGNNYSIYFCYRFNSFIYAASGAISELPSNVQASHVPDGVPIRDYLPSWLKLRMALVRRLPSSAVNLIAKIKYRMNAVTSRFERKAASADRN